MMKQVIFHKKISGLHILIAVNFFVMATEFFVMSTKEGIF